MDRQMKAMLHRALVLLLISLVLLMAVLGGTPCVLRKLTGIICPTCGMSRAWLSFFRWDIAAAFRFHPMFWCVPVLGIVYLFDGFSFPGRHLSRVLYMITVVGILLVYLVRLICFLSGDIAL